MSKPFIKLHQNGNPVMVNPKFIKQVRWFPNQLVVEFSNHRFDYFDYVCKCTLEAWFK